MITGSHTLWPRGAAEAGHGVPGRSSWSGRGRPSGRAW